MPESSPSEVVSTMTKALMAKVAATRTLHCRSPHYFGVMEIPERYGGKMGFNMV